MAKKGFQSVDDYIASQPEPVQKVLKHLRTIMRRALPTAEEVISYQIPAYKVNGRVAIYFAGWKDHYSLYPVTAPLATAFEKDFSKYELSGRGTVRFPISDKIPEKLIERVAKYRAQEVIAAGEARKKTAKKKPAASGR